MINPFKEINWAPDEKTLRKFAWSLIIGMPCLEIAFALIGYFRHGTWPDPHGMGRLSGIGFTVGLLSYYVPSVARPLYYVVYFLTACIGIVMANLLFMIMFYGLFAPIGLFMRLIGRDPLKLHWQKEAASTYWQDAEPSPPPAQYFSQF